jgi:hypothetical protein
MSEDLLLRGLEFFGCHPQFRPGKVQVIGVVDRYKMEVGVRHFQADDGKPASVAVKGFFDGKGDRLGKQQQAGQVFVGDIKEPVYFHFGHYERMAFPKRMDVQEGKKMLIFRNLIGRYFSGNDL